MAKKKKYQINERGIDEVLPVSRSQKKRDSHALKDLGAELAKLSVGQLKHIPLNDELLTAFTLMTKITNHEARRRQLQFIGKLLRHCDPSPIQDALATLQAGHNSNTALLHHAEQIRAALLSGNQDEKERMLAQWPSEAQELQALALKAKGQDNPETKGASRALFRKVRELLEADAKIATDTKNEE